MHPKKRLMSIFLTILFLFSSYSISIADDTPVGCSNDYVSGSNKILFPVANQDGHYNAAPYACSGSYWVDTVGTNWDSYCSTSWSLYVNKWTKSCADTFLSGRKEKVYPIANTNGQYSLDPYYCDGDFWVDTEGTNWDSYCETGWELTTLGEGCDTPPYSPSFWNNIAYIRYYNNCYNYGTNKRTDTFAQPGSAGGSPIVGTITAAKVYAASVADGLDPSTAYGGCLMNQTKIAVFVWPDVDYHWYRRDSNGYWSHKPGSTYATNLDNSNNVITNPETANRGNYTTLVGYFCTCSDTDQGDGHIVIQ